MTRKRLAIRLRFRIARYPESRSGAYAVGRAAGWAVDLRCSGLPDALWALRCWAQRAQRDTDLRKCFHQKGNAAASLVSPPHDHHTTYEWILELEPRCELHLEPVARGVGEQQIPKPRAGQVVVKF